MATEILNISYAVSCWASKIVILGNPKMLTLFLMLWFIILTCCIQKYFTLAILPIVKKFIGWLKFCFLFHSYCYCWNVWQMNVYIQYKIYLVFYHQGTNDFTSVWPIMKVWMKLITIFSFCNGFTFRQNVFHIIMPEKVIWSNLPSFLKMISYFRI